MSPLDWLNHKVTNSDVQGGTTTRGHHLGDFVLHGLVHSLDPESSAGDKPPNDEPKKHHGASAQGAGS